MFILQSLYMEGKQEQNKSNIIPIKKIMNLS